MKHEIILDEKDIHHIIGEHLKTKGYFLSGEFSIVSIDGKPLEMRAAVFVREDESCPKQAEDKKQ